MENSAVTNGSRFRFPEKGTALVEAAVMNMAVLAYEMGIYFLVWWDGDTPRCDILMGWEEESTEFELEREVA